MSLDVDDGRSDTTQLLPGSSRLHRWRLCHVIIVCLLSTALLVSLGVALSTLGHASQPKPEDQLVILFSIDGLWPGYLERDYPLPHLRHVMSTGVTVPSMQPCFPSFTFPNHYSLVTGLYPVWHGIVANTFDSPDISYTFTITSEQAQQDVRWWIGNPLWFVAEQQGVVSAPYMWPGSEAKRATYWTRFDDGVPWSQRVEWVIDALTAPNVTERARFATIYDSTVDTAGHTYGPDDVAAMGTAFATVDAHLGQLLEAIADAGLEERVNLVITSDHGMAEISPDRVVVVDDYVDVSRVHIPRYSVVTNVYCSPTLLCEQVVANLSSITGVTPYLRDSLPEAWHYRDSDRVGDVVLVADLGWSLGTRQQVETEPWKFTGGNHGYDATLAQMQAFFAARGPAFRRAYAHSEPIHNVDVYALLAHVLRVEPGPNNGTWSAVQPLLS